MMHLRDACVEVMRDPAVTARYPDGLSAGDVLTEIRAKHGSDAFVLCTVLDVWDEMNAHYGPGHHGER